MQNNSISDCSKMVDRQLLQNYYIAYQNIVSFVKDKGVKYELESDLVFKFAIYSNGHKRMIRNFGKVKNFYCKNCNK